MPRKLLQPRLHPPLLLKLPLRPPQNRLPLQNRPPPPHRLPLRSLPLQKRPPLPQNRLLPMPRLPWLSVEAKSLPKR